MCFVFRSDCTLISFSTWLCVLFFRFLFFFFFFIFFQLVSVDVVICYCLCLPLFNFDLLNPLCFAVSVWVFVCMCVWVYVFTAVVVWCLVVAKWLEIFRFPGKWRKWPIFCLCFALISNRAQWQRHPSRLISISNEFRNVIWMKLISHWNPASAIVET